jgi:cytochrome d ubiquinol oxidase subunit I
MDTIPTSDKMKMMTTLFLARLQFAFTVAFHYIYPPLSIGLGLILVMMEGLYLKTGNSLYHQMARFWVRRVFGLDLRRRRGHRHRHGI